ncbi:MAG: hypothetical protein QM708_02720 [Propioniciclava sp.]|uniref:hypothetical protein n=1 Tax=Propioniciclava sp. TaxID=2038686 RepID=UPI0039E340DE
MTGSTPEAIAKSDWSNGAARVCCPGTAPPLRIQQGSRGRHVRTLPGSNYSAEPARRPKRMPQPEDGSDPDLDRAAVQAFVEAFTAGDVEGVVALLAEDATSTPTDSGPDLRPDQRQDDGHGPQVGTIRHQL